MGVAKTDLMDFVWTQDAARRLVERAPRLEILLRATPSEAAGAVGPRERRRLAAVSGTASFLVRQSLSASGAASGAALEAAYLSSLEAALSDGSLVSGMEASCNCTLAITTVASVLEERKSPSPQPAPQPTQAPVPQPTAAVANGGGGKTSAASSTLVIVLASLGGALCLALALAGARARQKSAFAARFANESYTASPISTSTFNAMADSEFTTQNEMFGGGAGGSADDGQEPSGGGGAPRMERKSLAALAQSRLSRASLAVGQALGLVAAPNVEQQENLDLTDFSSDMAGAATRRLSSSLGYSSFGGNDGPAAFGGGTGSNADEQTNPLANVRATTAIMSLNEGAGIKSVGLEL
jgi:hypothetical protein